jgi:hypothetical protein
VWIAIYSSYAFPEFPIGPTTKISPICSFALGKASTDGLNCTLNEALGLTIPESTNDQNSEFSIPIG